jgi:hypothetical protein
MNFFEKHADKFIPEPNSGCWLWTGSQCSGYGIVMRPRAGHGVRARSRQLLAHRLAYEAANGPIPDGLQIRHICDTSFCINPDHLEPGTHQDNMDDKVKRGRSARLVGERNPRAKLTREQAELVRRGKRYGSGLYFAKLFGLSVAQIRRVQRGENWR